MSYRIEVSPNNRAVCSATKCKDEKVKITKGEMRHGVMITFKDKQSWKFRHWGCVTPEIIHHWKEASEGNMDLVDGYDELPDDAKEKVKRAFEQGHVDNEDWKGDVELNTPFDGQKNRGMFLKKSKKATVRGWAESCATLLTKVQGR
ncbi:zf-PARP-domain-containing protein [Piedraia hortae CBS 480.64]|uniref:Zf-PARP-domain-containing protein n=1 Tax=Piedraia hortae CBS 480.64 TaxID=1314780 RepID=A0A6A7C9J6_9PEZI|nr:zf-PARP-domain-containing protein [Piedraia hortae CBS 480.64]